MIGEERLIYYPDRYPAGIWQPEGLVYEDAWFTTDDGVRLHGWYVPHESPRAVLLFAHGNAGNLSHRVDILRVLHDLVGVSVLIFDYRGYGRSEGQPSERGLYADARAARRWLGEREEIAEGAIVLLGRSLGGGVMVELAATDGARALVLESTFTNVPDVAVGHFPLLPLRQMMHTRYDSLAKIDRYHGPLLMSHGTADTIVPYRLGRELFEAAGEPKQFFDIEGGDHNDPPPPAYYAALARFLEVLGTA
ncbi:MAG: alpha/beta hydrolase [Planctomycetales bacterium]|nr:alpha/beta hydrolase [Planctomycetales bacterium]